MPCLAQKRRSFEPLSLAIPESRDNPLAASHYCKRFRVALETFIQVNYNAYLHARAAIATARACRGSGVFERSGRTGGTPRSVARLCRERHGSGQAASGHCGGVRRTRHPRRPFDRGRRQETGPASAEFSARCSDCSPFEAYAGLHVLLENLPCAWRTRGAMR
jgi:hypothetical protein